MKQIYTLIAMSLFLSITAFGQQNYIYYEYDTICSNSSINWRGSTIIEPGTHYDSLMTVLGGDSIYVLYLYVQQSYQTEINAYICEDDTFNWQGNAYINTGTYQQNYSTICGCDSLFILNLVVNHKPDIDLGSDITAPIGSSVVLDAGLHDHYMWSTGGNSQQEVIEVDNQYPISVNVSVRVTDNLCSNEDEITIQFTSATGIEPTNEQQFSVYPNPSSGQFNIESNETYHYKVYDISGNKIVDNEGNGNSKVNLSEFENGMYFMELESETGTQSIKLIKK